MKREEYISDEAVIKRANEAVRIELEKNKALTQVKDVIYNNSDSRPFRIFKKRKEEIYFDECDDWHYEDIGALTDISNMERKNLKNQGL